MAWSSSRAKKPISKSSIGAPTPSPRTSLPVTKEENLVDLGTANDTVLSTTKSYLECPICIETLFPPIFQCSNGHLVCNVCVEKIDQCGECRAPMNSGNRIRSLVLENISRSLVVQCPQQSMGCNVKTTVETLKTHLEFCEFLPLCICSKLLGLKNCRVAVNDQSVLEHLEELHQIVKLNRPRVRIWLNASSILLLAADDAYFQPLILKAMGTQILLRSMVSTVGILSFTCFILKHAGEEELKKYRVKYRIESKTKQSFVEWSGCMQPYRKFDKIDNLNSFCVSYEHLKDYCEDSPLLKVPMKVAMWKTTETIPDLEKEITFEEVFTFKRSSFNPAQ